jgi:hypothetical protein
MEETLRTRRMRLVAYCLMPNHWQFVGWPENDGDLAAFMQQMNTSIKSCATRSGTACVPIRGQERSRGAGRVFVGTHVMTRHFACFSIGRCLALWTGWRSSISRRLTRNCKRCGGASAAAVPMAMQTGWPGPRRRSVSSSPCGNEEGRNKTARRTGQRHLSCSHLKMPRCP